MLPAKNNPIRGRDTSRRDSATAFGLGAALGVLVFLLVYGPSTLDVTYDSWIYAGYMEQDILQRYAGWLYLRNSGWSWPLTVAQNLSVPYGASIVFTDSLPLAALVAKLLSPLLPQTFQYFGWVNLLNFALQGGFGALLLRSLGCGRVYSTLGSLVFLTLPVFVERAFRHDTLGAQWLILAALWLYFASRRRARFPAAGFTVFCLLALGIHTYFVPMVYAIFLAALLGWALRGPQGAKGVRAKRLGMAAMYLGAAMVLTFLAAYALGMVTRGGSGTTQGYGSYSMNLNALINPRSFDLYADSLYLGWSRFLPVRPQNYHQYDGFNYPGLGMLLAWAAVVGYGLVRLVQCLVRKSYGPLRRAGGFVKSHRWLLLVCLCFVVFAPSNVVVWDATTLLEIPLPDFLLRFAAIFRSSGRMLWPVAYLAVLAVLVAAWRLLRPRWRSAAVLLLLALQLLDYGQVLVQKHQYFAAGPIQVKNEFTSDGWQYLMENYSHVECLGFYYDYELGAGIIRYNPGMTTNMILTNRGDFALITDSYAPTIAYLAQGGRPAEGVLYICEDEGTFRTILAGAHADARGYEMGRIYVLCLPVGEMPLQEYQPF